MYSPTACGVWSFCHEVENTYGEHSSPASCEGPALAMTSHGLGIDDRLERRQQHVRPDIADDEIDLVGFDQLLGLLLADVRLLPVVFVDHLDRETADLAAHMIERELERIAHVVADHRGRAAEGRDEADLDRLVCWAAAGPAASARIAPAAISDFFIFSFLRYFGRPLELPVILLNCSGYRKPCRRATLRCG